jgi:hypothetical protein
LIIIDTALEDGVIRIQGLDRGVLSKVFEDLVKGQDIKWVCLTVHREHGLNRYVNEVDKIKQYLLTGDPKLFYCWNKKTHKRYDKKIKTIWEEKDEQR